MGKSPGKWIKTVLFGKKPSKSNLSKNAAPDRKAAAETPVEDLAGDPPVVSNPFQFTDKGGAEDMELAKGKSGNPGTTIASVPVDQDLESQRNFTKVPMSDDEMRREGQAATKAQAAFRGYLARRAFKALKGIIRLQALIRAHLVRRQAVATLRCMQAIVKFQALARGRRVRLSNTMSEVGKKYNIEVATRTNSKFGSEKLARNAYIRKLLSLPTAMPLNIQYDEAEPNSAWNWLERWSASHFWKPPARPRKVSRTKPQRKLGSSQIVENEAGKSKRSIRKPSSAANVDNGALSSFETDKTKRNPGKVTSHQTELVQEQPQTELERLKRNLRKVSASVPAAPGKLETETEKLQQQLSSKTVINSASPDVSEKKMVVSAENPTDSDVIVDKIAVLEAPSKTVTTVDLVDVPHDDHPLAEPRSVENGNKMEGIPFLHDEVTEKEGEWDKENQKIRKRRSLPAKQEYPENTSLNSSSLPSYMAATQSAKGKLKIHSFRFSEDGSEVGYIRRHSLPASTNGKLSSLSPRIQKPVRANGKASSKTNRSMTSFRDDKLLQLGWRR